MMILGLDPNPLVIASVLFDTVRGVVLGHWTTETTATMRELMNGTFHVRLETLGAEAKTTVWAIEGLESRGMTIGQETFDTVFLSGRLFQQLSSLGWDVRLIGRSKVKIAICGSMRATDTSIRHAILDLWGGKQAAIGHRATPGPFYGIHHHEWQALAVALTVNPDVITRRVMGPHGG